LKIDFGKVDTRIRQLGIHCINRVIQTVSGNAIPKIRNINQPAPHFLVAHLFVISGVRSQVLNQHARKTVVISLVRKDVVVAGHD
jgi:hypothetical protein